MTAPTEPTANNTTENKEKAPLSFLRGKLLEDAKVLQNSNNKTYALAKISKAPKKGEDGMEVEDAGSITIMTYAKPGIAALEGKKAGDNLSLYGVWEKNDKGRTFTAMGVPKNKEVTTEPTL